MTVLFSWLAFRGTHWAEQWESLRGANYLWLLPYLAICFVIHFCRAARWGALLSGIERVPFRALNEASAIGFMMLIVLPFRLGEFARPFLVAQRSGIRRSAAMTTVVLERIVDGIVVAALLRGLLFFVPESETVGYVPLRRERDVRDLRRRAGLPPLRALAAGPRGRPGAGLDRPVLARDRGQGRRGRRRVRRRDEAAPLGRPDRALLPLHRALLGAERPRDGAARPRVRLRRRRRDLPAARARSVPGLRGDVLARGAADGARRAGDDGHLPDRA